LISPDADRRAITRGAFAGGAMTGAATDEDFESGRGSGVREMVAASDNSFACRCGGGARDLAVSVPPRQLSRPNLGGPAILITSRPPSSQASSRPCSAASSLGSSRPSSASLLGRGCPTPGSRPMSQRRMIHEFDQKLSVVLPGGLLLGAEQSACDEAKLMAEGVTAIVNCAGIICANHFPRRFTYLKLNLLDTAREDISSVFYDALDFIDDTISNQHGAVFVHCQHGVSRSSTLVIAYVMWKHQLTYDDALEFVRSCRPTINPNIGFACALLQWGSSIQGPPHTLHGWGLGTGVLLGDGQTPVAGTSAAAAAAASVAASSATDSADAKTAAARLYMRPVTMPACTQSLTRAAGCFASEAELMTAREAIRGELREKGNALVLQRDSHAAVWLPKAALLVSEREAVERHLVRLCKYHHLPSRRIILRECDNTEESEAFWALFDPPTPAPQQLAQTGSGSFDPPALTSLAKSFTEALDFDSPTPNSLPFPLYASRPGTFRPTFDASSESGEAANCSHITRPELEISGPEKSCSDSDDLSTPGGRIFSQAHDAHDAGGSAGCGASASWGTASGRVGLAIRTPSLDLSHHMVRRASSYAVLASDPMDSSPPPNRPPAHEATERARSEGRLDEMMAVTALQTVAYELLVVLQGPNAGSSQPTIPQAGMDDGKPPDRNRSATDAEDVLSPLDLLLAYQPKITGQPKTSDEAHDIVGALDALLCQIAPALAQMPTFEPLSVALSSFLLSVPSLRGEALLQAEDALLSEISKAAERDVTHHLDEGADEEDGTTAWALPCAAALPASHQ